MKKCPMCGGDVPIDNAICNNCGYSFNTKNKGVFYNHGTNSSGVTNVDSAKFGKGFKIFLIIFCIVFFLPIIIMVFMFLNMVFFVSNFDYDDEYLEEEYYYCSDLCVDSTDFVEKNDKCVCGNGDIYYMYGGDLYYESDGFLDNYYRCETYCNDMPIDYDDTFCTCLNGDKFDRDGDIIYSENVNDVTLNNWKNDIYSNKTVLTVVCDEDKDFMCGSYKLIAEDVAVTNDIDIYYFDLSDLNSYQKENLLYSFDINFYDNIPNTFIIKNQKYLSSMYGGFNSQALEKFLSDNDVI